MKKLQIFLFLLLISLIGVLFYSNRALFTAKYDAFYWKDRFEHSQWALPLSPRTLGDNGLYGFVGYQLVHGANPTKYNAQMPPMGKYAIGAIIQFTGNGYWYGVMSTLLVWMLFFILAKKILNNSLLALAATAWLAFDPLLISQWTATMLDTVQLACLLAFFIVLNDYGKQKRTVIYTVLLGVALGAFSAIKFPMLSVVLAAAGCYYLWHMKRSAPNIVIFLGTALITYILTYTKYFLAGYTILDWVRVQKWMISFYWQSGLQANVGSIWTTILAGRLQNLFTKQWQTVPEWSIAWPVITLGNFYIFFRLIRKNYVNRLFLLVMSLSITLMSLLYTFTPFWTRYLILILPFLYLTMTLVLKTIKIKWVIVLCALGLIILNGITSWRIIFPTPEADVQQFVYDWKNGFFQDMYERFTADVKTKPDKYTFLRSMQAITRDGEIESTDIVIAPTRWKQFTSPQYVPLTITYSTRQLGKFTETIRLPVIHENGQWRIGWEPQYFIAELTSDSTLRTSILPRGIPLGVTVWITPKDIDSTQEQFMLKELEALFGGLPKKASAIGFYHMYHINSQPDWPVCIGTLAATPTISLPGLTLTPRVAIAGGKLELLDAGGTVKRTLIDVSYDSLDKSP